MLARRFSLRPTIGLLLLALVGPAPGAEDDEGEFVQLPPGLRAVYESSPGQRLFERREPAPRLFAAPGDAPHPRAPAEAFRVAWSGRLLAPLDGEFTFSLGASSLRDVRFTLGGRAVDFGKPVELKFGNVPMELSGVHAGGAPALELAWEHPTFAREVIHPRFFGHVEAILKTPAILAQATEDSAAALAESFGCFRCHAGPAAWLGSLGPSADAAALLPGPQLTSVGARIHRAWLPLFLRDPAAHRPGTRMPAQFDDSPADREALEIVAAYLASGQTARAADAPSGSADNGRKLYQAAGCAACHEPPEGSLVAPGAPLRVPSLERLAEKWTADGLAAFLQSPLSLRPHGRMPQFAFGEAECRDLAAHLLTRDRSGKAPALVAIPKGAAPAGRDAFASAVPLEGLVVWLPLDETAGPPADRSGQGRAAKVAGGVVTFGQEGTRGRAAGFDGKGGHLVVDDAPALSSAADFTWAAWIKTTASGAILGRAPAAGDWVPGGKTLFVRDGRLCFDVGWVGVVASRARVDDGRWRHVAVTVQLDADRARRRDLVVLYLDGREDARRNDWNVAQHPEKDFVLKLGAASANFPQSATLTGLIDDVAMWRRALDPTEIAAVAEGSSHLADTEAALFTPQRLKAQWTASGGSPAESSRFGPGVRLKAAALAAMAARGCLHCHDPGAQSLVRLDRRADGPPAMGNVRPLVAPPLLGLAAGRLAAGCMTAASPSPPRGEGDSVLLRSQSPRFDFTPEERAALTAYVGSLADRNRPSSAEALSVEMRLLNCAACHENDGHGGEPLAALLGGKEKARFLMPHGLNEAAARLRPERLDELLRDGARGNALRPWLGAKMPGFGPRGSRVADLLCLRDRVDGPVRSTGPEPAERSEPAVPQNQIDMARLLVSNKGLTCVNCHPINGRQPSGEPDPSTRAPDLGLVGAHLRAEYFPRWLRDPGRVFPGTKMPVILPRNGPIAAPSLKDVPRDVLARALWGYLSLGRHAPPPIEEDPAEALPKMLRAYVQRGPTFVGDRLFGRGIACGFPTGTLLFDADALEPGAMWFDGFLNRVPTNYFGLNWRAPDGHEMLAGPPSLAWRPAADRPWQTSPRPLDCDPNTAARFDGYSLGAAGVVLRYRLAWGGRPMPVAETLRIDRREAWRGFVRELRFEGLPAGCDVAWTAPLDQRPRFFSARGADVSPAGGPPGTALTVGEAPIIVDRQGGRVRAVRVEAPQGAFWETGRGGELRVVSPKASQDGTSSLRIGRWTSAVAGREPTEAEIAGLADWNAAAGLPSDASSPPTAKPPVPPQLASSAPLQEEPFGYRLEMIPGPPQNEWRPSGLAFTPDGTMYACDLTLGRVYRAALPPRQTPKDFGKSWQLFAAGLNVPTGMAAIGSRVFVAQRPEVTELIDRDRDGAADAFRTLMGPWSLKDGFHEYAFGLAVDPQQRLYVALNNGYFWSYGGPTNRGRYRSSVMRCDLEGRSEEVGWGCRVPNGVSHGPDGQVFFIDNQGDWIQVCKLVHCRKGVFYGHPETERQFLPDGQAPEGLPAVWIPYEVIRSAAALGFDDTGGKFGPFAGQFFTGDVGYGQSVNIMRMAIEQVDGAYQGAAFRFVDGPPQGPQHAAFGPDGQMYLSCLTDGIVRLRYGGRAPMEIHRVALRRDNRGFTVHLTRPLAADAAATPQTLRARRWCYPYGIAYGSPRVDEADVPVEHIEVSADRRALDVFLPVKTYKNCMVYYFHLGKLRSAEGEELAHPEAWYTVQRLWK